MQGAAPAMFAAGAQINMAPTMQWWLLHNEGSAARLQVNLTEITYGIDVETESKTKPGTYINYKDDMTCRWSGSPRIDAAAGGRLNDAQLRIDGKRMAYELRIPGDRIFVELVSVCSLKKGPVRSSQGGSVEGGRAIRVPLMGKPKGDSAVSSSAEFKELLTFKGKVASASNPRLSGKRSFAADMSGYGTSAGPVKVTVEWQFVGGK